MKFQSEAVVLECKSGTGKKSGNPYHMVLFKAGDVVARTFSDISLQDQVDEKVMLTFGVRANADLSMGVKITACERL